MTRDPDTRYTPQKNTCVASYTLAVSRKFAKDEADFINILAWGKLGEFTSKYFKKGKQVAVVGRLQTRNYEKDGVKHYITEVIAEESYFADSKEQMQFNDVPINEVDNNDDLPF